MVDMGKLFIDGKERGEVAFQLPSDPKQQERFLGWIAIQLHKIGYPITTETKIAIVEGNILVANNLHSDDR